MLTIRLRRKGKKNQPFFRVVVVDKRKSSKSGRSVEDLGYKNPLTKKVFLDKERVLYWISKGAKPSPTVNNMLVSEKIIGAKKINVSKKSKKPAESIAPAVATPETNTEAKPAGEPAPVASPTPAAGDANPAV